MRKKRTLVVTEDSLVPGTPWAEIRSLVELGVPATHVAKAYHISDAVISRRKKAEKWSTPKEVSEKARQLLAESIGDSNDQNPLLTMRARELLDRHLKLREMAHDIASAGMEGLKTVKRVPTTFFEAEALMRIADKAAGQDSPNRDNHGFCQGESQSNPGARCAISVNFLVPYNQRQGAFDVLGIQGNDSQRNRACG